MYERCELTGAEFNSIYTGRLYKFLNSTLRHHGFRYEVGLNIDTQTFNPTGSCSKGGLYFCGESNYHLYWNQFGPKVAAIKIPDDARAYVEKDKFKADRLVITEITDFKDVSDRFWINILCKDHRVLKHIKNQTDELCEIAIKHSGHAIRHVTNQTDRLCMQAVQQNGLALQHVKIHTKEIYEAAVKQNGLALQYVDMQTLQLCRLAVQQNRSALQYVNWRFKNSDFTIY